jgi:hypothetical protein
MQAGGEEGPVFGHDARVGSHRCERRNMSWRLGV